MSTSRSNFRPCPKKSDKWLLIDGGRKAKWVISLKTEGKMSDWFENSTSCVLSSAMLNASNF